MKEKSYSASYDVTLAKAYGIPVAVLVNNVRYFSAVNRADGKGQYYHSMKAIADATGLSYRQVRDAAKKAQEAGLIDFRFGYKPNTSEKTTYWSDGMVISEVDKMLTSESDERLTSLNNMKEENIKELDTNVSRAKSHDDEQKEFGNSEINAIFQAWTDAGLPAITSRVQANRRAVWNMLRNKAIGKGKVLELIRLTAQSQSDPYAPGVPDLETLSRRVGALEQWKIRRQAKANELTKPVEPVYQRRPYDQRPSILDQEKVTEVFSDDFYEEMRQRVHGKRKEQNNEQQ